MVFLEFLMDFMHFPIDFLDFQIDFLHCPMDFLDLPMNFFAVPMDKDFLDSSMDGCSCRLELAYGFIKYFAFCYLTRLGDGFVFGG